MSELQQLRGHVTSEMKAAPIVGRVTPTNELTVTVGLVVDGNALTYGSNASFRSAKSNVPAIYDAGTSRRCIWCRSFGL